MNNFNNNMKGMTIAVACAALSISMHAYGQPPRAFAPAEGAGGVLIGVAGGGTDQWVCPGGDNAFDGQIAVRHMQTDDKRSLAIEVTNLSLPDSTRLIWVIGGFDAPSQAAHIEPEHCADNVFSVEGNQVAIYHGEVMHLRFSKALVPPGSDVRLCDGRKQDSPTATFNSGKKTDAPVLGGSVTMERGKPVYISIGRPRQKECYTYSELPRLFGRKNNTAR
mgnify:FL=1